MPTKDLINTKRVHVLAVGNSRSRWRSPKELSTNSILCTTGAASVQKPRVAVQWVTVLFGVREVPGANVGPQAGYPIVNSSVPPGK